MHRVDHRPEDGLALSSALPSRTAPHAQVRLGIQASTPLIFHQWGEAFFVFHPDSGLTHFLNQTGVDILRFLERETLTTDELYARLLARYEIDEDAELLESIETVTALLEQLGVLTSTR